MSFVLQIDIPETAFFSIRKSPSEFAAEVRQKILAKRNGPINSNQKMREEDHHEKRRN